MPLKLPLPALSPLPRSMTELTECGGVQEQFVTSATELRSRLAQAPTGTCLCLAMAPGMTHVLNGIAILIDNTTLVLQGNGVTFDAGYRSRIFEVTNGGKLEFHRVHLRRGFVTMPANPNGGGCLYAQGDTVVVGVSSTFTHCSSPTWIGGCFFADKKASVKLYRTQMYDCVGLYGGAAYAHTGSLVQFIDSSLSKSEAHWVGCFSARGSLCIHGSSVGQCTAFNNGGIDVLTLGVLHFNHSIFHNSSASEKSGGPQFRAGYIQGLVYRSEFIELTSETSAGAITVAGGFNQFHMYGCKIAH